MMSSSLPPDGPVSDLDFTGKAFDTFCDAVDDPYFLKEDLTVIYDTLKNRMESVPFGDYLKRYIYQKAELSGAYQEIPVSEYRDIICDSFREQQTPASFTPTSARLKNLAKNWLEQKTAGRNLVLLLGFGLGMSANDVNMFLTKALKEQRLYAKDPFEVLCWYCYRFGCGYVKFEQLWQKYRQCAPEPGSIPPVLDSTYEFKQHVLAIKDEDQLLRFLQGLPIVPGTARQSMMARKQFDLLYEQTRDWVAEVLTGIEKSSAGVRRDRLRGDLSGDPRYDHSEKEEMLEKADQDYHEYHGTEIGAAQVEQVAFAAIPKDKYGNLLPMKASTLCNQFSGARLSRQHLTEIISGKAQITRYDLITLSFFAFFHKRQESDLRLVRYSAFIEFANDILEKSDMGPLYPVNPYESFIMMCVLSSDPIGTFSDVWELSYTDTE